MTSSQLLFDTLRQSVWYSIELVWLFFPILAANQMGHFPYWKMPVSVRYLGGNKTRGAYVAGPLYAMTAVSVLWVIEPKLSAHFGVLTLGDAFRVGALIGLGVVLGDQLNSCQKRLRGMPQGTPSILDRFDWALGGGIFATLALDNVEASHVLALVDIAAPAHVYFNRNSYLRGWRKTEH